MTALIVGVLAVQGDFREHREALERLGVEVVEVRVPAQLDDVAALVLPGGESTAISKLLATSGLFDAIQRRLAKQELPLFGTCAGAILAARDVLDGIPDQQSFGVFNAQVRRNGIGPQRYSYEAPLTVSGLAEPFVTVFIRPPVIESVGDDVEILAESKDKPVLCAQGSHLFATFHPELTADDRIHSLFLERLKA